MAEYPILFTGAMVRAILAGRKTQTRRLVRNEFGVCGACLLAGVPHPNGDGGAGVFGTAPYLKVAYCEHTDRMGGRTRCPYGVAGDSLWVRETWGPCEGGIIYRASEDDGVLPDDGRWHPSIHMNRAFSRLTPPVVATRLERLQAITFADAKAEGAHHRDGGLNRWRKQREGWSMQDPHPIDVDLVQGFEHCLGSAEFAFGAMWNELNQARAAWSSNPWVWVVEFERVAQEVRS